MRAYIPPPSFVFLALLGAEIAGGRIFLPPPPHSSRARNAQTSPVHDRTHPLSSTRGIKHPRRVQTNRLTPSPGPGGSTIDIRVQVTARALRVALSLGPLGAVVIA